MTRIGHTAILTAILLGGCVYQSQARVDQTVSGLVNHPYDQQPSSAAMPAPVMPPANFPLPPGINRAATAPPRPATDVQTVAWLETAGPNNQGPGNPGPGGESHLDLNIPPDIPGSEARRLAMPREEAAREQAIRRIYPELPPLPPEVMPLPGPNGRPYNLADFQQIAVANSPRLRQAASDVEAARGALIASDAYPNPTLSYQFTPSNNGSTPSADGMGIDQTIKTGGKLGLARASAEMAFHNAELALRRARSDLATQVRNAYFAVLVAKETVRVNRGLAHFTDEVYQLQARMLLAGQAAAYEPAALRAQAYGARLAYRQSIQTYIYSWKQLVSTINMRQLPLTEVSGRVDSMIPLYDYDALLAYVLRNHTDMLIAYNGVEIARYNLKLAQVTPIPDVDVNLSVVKDFSEYPKQTTPTLMLGVPLGVWDRNKGGIISAEAALVRATEEPHRVEMNLANTLAGAFMNYKTNLDALEYYRRFILPDEVRAYRGAYDRRHIDPNASFGDVVSAQQTLAASVTTYLTTLGQVWTSVTAVADLIQTDDLFQFARPEAVPPLPGIDQLPALPCCHPGAPAAAAGVPAPAGMSQQLPPPQFGGRPMPQGAMNGSTMTMGTMVGQGG